MRSKMIRVLGFVMVLTGVSGVALWSGAQPEAPSVPPDAPPVPPLSITHGGGALEVVDLSSDTFVTVKDFGDSQTVSVYKVSDSGELRQTAQKRFLYR